MNILEEILDNKKIEVENFKKSYPINDLIKGISEKKLVKRSLFEALSRSEVGIIAEIKRQSPSKGIISDDFQPLKVAMDYFDGGASAISILTDEKYFGGKLDYLTAIRTVVDIPLLRKDFILDEYQIYQSKFYGADAILLIGKVLEDSKLNSLVNLANDLELEVLYEVHDKSDLQKGLNANINIFGINNRNLENFSVDSSNVLKFIDLIPNNKLLVSESGILSKEDLDKLNCSGINNFLIGEYLMRSNERVKKLKELLGK